MSENLLLGGHSACSQAANFSLWLCRESCSPTPRGTKPSPSGPSSLPKAPPPNTSALGVKVSYRLAGRDTVYGSQAGKAPLERFSPCVSCLKHRISGRSRELAHTQRWVTPQMDTAGSLFPVWVDVGSQACALNSPEIECKWGEAGQSTSCSNLRVNVYILDATLF